MKTRPVLLVVVTLIIGFVLGMLTSAQLRFHRLKPVRVFYSEERFREGFYKAIQPDEEQKARIDLILDKYAKINSNLQNDFRKQLEASMKEFRKEVDAKLSKEQVARLKEMDERRQQMIRDSRKKHRNDSTDYRNDRRNDFDRRDGPGGTPPPQPPSDSINSKKSSDTK